MSWSWAGCAAGVGAALAGVGVGWWIRGQAEPPEPRRHGVELVDVDQDTGSVIYPRAFRGR